MKLADISQFEALSQKATTSMSPISVFNGTAWARYASNEGTYIIQAVPTQNKNYLVYKYAPVAKALNPNAWQQMGYQKASNRGSVTEAFSRTQGINLSRLKRGGNYTRKLPDLTQLPDETFAEAMNNIRFYGQLLNWIPGEFTNSETAQYRRDHPFLTWLYQKAEQLTDWAFRKRKQIEDTRDPVHLLEEFASTGAELTPILGRGLDIRRAIGLIGKIFGNQQYKDNVHRARTQASVAPGTQAENTF